MKGGITISKEAIPIRSCYSNVYDFVLKIINTFKVKECLLQLSVGNLPIFCRLGTIN